MTAYIGDFAEDVTVTYWWDSNDGDGASITRATDGTIKVIRDDGTDCTGTSVTDSEDSVDTGVHKVAVDTSDSANFATGHDYLCWVDGAVIDGETVNAGLFAFSIENRFDEVDAVKIDGTAQRATDLAEIAQYLIANAATLTDIVADNSILAKLLATNGDISEYSEATDSLQSIRDVAPHGTAQSGDAYSYLTTNLGALGANATEAGGTGDQFTAIPWNSSWDTEVESEVTDALEAINLDHLMKTGDATLTNIVEDNTALAHLMASGADISDFDSSTDSLEGIVDNSIGADLFGLQNSVNTIDGIVDAILVDTGTTIPGTITTMQGNVTDILADTNELQANQGNWLTATGFSTHDAAAVKTAMEADGSKLDHLWEMTEDDGGTRRLTTNSLEQAPSGTGLSLTDAVGDGQSAGTVGKALENAIDYLDAAISGVGGATGSGSKSCTLTVKDADGSAVEGAAVWVTNDEAGSDVVAGTSYSNTNGQVTFMLDAGSYYCWKQHSDHEFTNPESFTVS